MHLHSLIIPVLHLHTPSHGSSGSDAQSPSFWQVENVPVFLLQFPGAAAAGAEAGADEANCRNAGALLPSSLLRHELMFIHCFPFFPFLSDWYPALHSHVLPTPGAGTSAHVEAVSPAALHGLFSQPRMSEHLSPCCENPAVQAHEYPVLGGFQSLHVAAVSPSDVHFVEPPSSPAQLLISTQTPFTDW